MSLELLFGTRTSTDDINTITEIGHEAISIIESDPILKLVKRMIDYNPENRPKYSEVRCLLNGLSITDKGYLNFRKSNQIFVRR